MEAFQQELDIKLGAREAHSHFSKRITMAITDHAHPDSISEGRNRKGSRSRSIATVLTCLQFMLAMYATLLLCFMDTQINLSSSSPLTKKWRGFLHLTSLQAPNVLSKQDVCLSEEINFQQKISNDTSMLSIKKKLYNEVLQFQQMTRGCETLEGLLKTPSQALTTKPKITVILNHYRRKTLCAQIEALQAQTLSFHRLWVLAFNSPMTESLETIVEAFNDTRISFVGSTHDFKYYGRFQLALQADEADYVYILDDDMIPGKKMLEIFTHAAGTNKYSNAVLGSIGRILPFRQKDYSFPSYRKYGIREAGLYLPDPAYNIVVRHVLQVDFLSSSWFLPASLINTFFTETPFTFATGEDLHLSYQLQKYKGAGSFIVPVDLKDKDTWGDTEHRLAYVSETTLVHKAIIQLRDRQWWQAMSRGFVTQWATMYPQQSDALFYAHSIDEVKDLAPLIRHFRNTSGKKVYVAVAGGVQCPCNHAALQLGWSQNSCYERRFKIFDLGISSSSTVGYDVTLMRDILAAVKGLIKIHSPAVFVTIADLLPTVQGALLKAMDQHSTTLIQLPRSSIPHCLWMADLKHSALQQWNKPRISINIVTQNRPASLQRLLTSVSQAHYIGDSITLSINMDSGVDTDTLKIVSRFQWPHGNKQVRRRVVQGGLIRAVSESWYPSSEDEFGLLLEDDVEVSPFYYMWLKYCLFAYHYSPHPSFPDLASISLYTPRVVEVVKERPKWNATDYFRGVHPNTPYLHQLPCSWGALFFPKHWREFYKYMATRHTMDAKQNLVQIPHSRTNGWQASWKKFLVDVMYLRGYVTLYPNFPNQTSFSTNHMEPGAHINASNNIVIHKREDFEVPLMQEEFYTMLPEQKLPPPSKLPVINLFNQITTLKGLKAAGSKLGQDVLHCNPSEIVTVDYKTGDPLQCIPI